MYCTIKSSEHLQNCLLLLKSFKPWQCCRYYVGTIWDTYKESELIELIRIVLSMKWMFITKKVALQAKSRNCQLQWEIQPLGEEQYKFTLSSSCTWQFITDIIYAYLHHEVTFHFGKESYSRICKILTRSAYRMRGQLNLYVAIDSWLLNSHPNDFKYVMLHKCNFVNI